VAFAIVITDKRQAIAVGQAAALQAGSTLKASVEAKGIGFAQFDALSAAVQNTPADKVPGGDYKQWLGNPKFKLAPALGTPCLVLVDKGGHPVKALPLPPDAPSILAAILN
jgi:hypothetical protein